MERSLEPTTTAVVEQYRQSVVLVPLLASGRPVQSMAGGPDQPRYSRAKVEIVNYRNPGRTTLRAARDRVLFLCNGDYTVNVIGMRGDLALEPRNWAYLGHGPIELVSSGGPQCVIAIQKPALQAIASAKTGAARKLADSVLALRALPIDILVGKTNIAGPDLEWHKATESPAALIDMLACAMLATESLDFIFPIARGINRAMSYINEHLSEACTPERLARVVGVTPRTVREGFHNYLGISVAHYVRQVRLCWARKRLESGRESRSVRELASFLGFQDSPAFSRAYQREFGESPTETRARSTRSIC